LDIPAPSVSQEALLTMKLGISWPSQHHQIVK